MALAPGVRIGVYEIVGPLGAGGMGEVYRARDTKLNRDVAVKVVPEAFAIDSDRLARFQREAQVLASLNHPNIAAIYGFEEAPGVQALILELVEGPTLADLLAPGFASGHHGASRDSASGPGPEAGSPTPTRGLPLDDVIPIARQIAEALETAHDQGIVHRDLKPANVKVTPGGVVKVLDFGLAKILETDAVAGGSRPGISMSPTLSVHATMHGVILGTAAYMSPEQARGKPVDRRTDIWAFGCVLFEMLTGRQIFGGETLTDTVAAIIKNEPDWNALPGDTPPYLRSLLRRCLQKDPRRRLPHIGVARIEIDEGGKGAEQPIVPPASATAVRARPTIVPWAIATLAVIVAAALAWARFRDPLDDRPGIVRFVLEAPEGSSLGHHIPTRGGGNVAPNFAVSPDGRRIVYAMYAADGPTRLWVRRIDAVAAQPVPGTEDGSFPFWSPDGRYIAFFSDGKLRKVEAAGGPAQTICDAPEGEGGTWNQDNVIVFAPQLNGPLFRVSAAGGAPVQLTALDSTREEAAHRWPQFLPDGRHFLYLSVTGRRGVNVPISAAALDDGRQLWLGSLDSTERSLILRGTIRAGYAGGHLLFVRDRRLMAQPFDADRLQLSGEPVAIVDEVSSSVQNGRTAFAVSSVDTLVYRAGFESTRGQLTWFDRSGKRLGTIGEPGSYTEIQFSPDGKKFGAFVGERQSTTGGDIWIYDLERGGLQSRLTTTAEAELGLAWSPDSAYVAYAAGENATEIFRQPTTGGAPELMLKSAGAKRPRAWSADGRYLVFNHVGEGGGTDLSLLAFPDKTSAPLLHTPFSERNAVVSPDGRWYAYDSNKDSGGFALYVRPFPTGDREIRVSPGEGTYPYWRQDGKELLYIAGRDVMAVAVTPGNPLRFGAPVKLFTAPITTSGLGAYAVTADGQRLLAVDTSQSEGGAAPLTVVLNWTEQLPK